MGLADPGLTRQQHHTAPPLGRLLEASQQTRHLRDAAEIPRPGRIRVPRVPRELRRLPQDRHLQISQLRARNDPQVLLKDPPEPVECIQRLRLPPVAVERDHELAPPPFTQRATGHQSLQLAHDLVVAAQRELRIEQILQRRFA